MDAELYQEIILDRYHHPQHRGQPAGATHTAAGANYSCGDELTLFAKVKEAKITTIGFEAQACAICTASADLLCDRLTGQPLDAVKEITTEDITVSLGIPLSPTRLKCALLPLETARQLEAQG